MYCRTCGKEINENSEICPNCGVKPLAGKYFCQNCGAETKENQEICIKCGVKLQNTSNILKNSKSKIAAGLFGILLGSLGIHKFYLGYTGPGIIMLLVSIIGGIITFGIASGVIGIIGIIEGIIYLTKTDEDFYEIYVKNEKTWF
ncbi:MAG: hypothetical protein PWQ09_1029 [Candidatus Cloacimonadota bacterium]|jgi:TM2 domain-containing membrane protein YozV|nr:hypothetical protein [Candidatus Cloacimonadota bacterium]